MCICVELKMFLVLMVMVFLLWIVRLRWQLKGFIQLADQLMSSYYSIPLIGHSYLFLGGEERRMRGLQIIGRDAIKHGGITALWHAYHLFIILTDPVAVDCVLKHSLGKGDIEKFMRPVTGKGSIFAPVPIWRPRRKILALTFSPKILSRFVDIFANHSSVLVDSMRKTVGKGTVSIWSMVTAFTMGSICETTLGVKFEKQEKSIHPFLKAVDEVTSLAATRIYRPWLHSDFVFKKTLYWQQAMKIKKIIYNFIQKIIQKQHEINKDKNTIPDVPEEFLGTFLNMLIKSSKAIGGYTDVELQEETLGLIIAGTDTSAVGIAFTLLMLSRHFHVQEKVYQELKEVFGDSDRRVENDDLPKMVYLEAVIKETLRLYPPVPAILRKIEKDIKLPSGVTLLNDCYAMVHIWALQRNPQFWGDDAEIFRPERFTDSPPKHPFAFIPFSLGPRGCIGSQYAMMSMKTAISSLLRHYRLMPPAEKTNVPIQLKFDIFLRDAGKYLIQIESRT